MPRRGANFPVFQGGSPRRHDEDPINVALTAVEFDSTYYRAIRIDDFAPEVSAFRDVASGELIELCLKANPDSRLEIDPEIKRLEFRYYYGWTEQRKEWWNGIKQKFPS